ncbi:uncharacterized protein JCM15063_001062 [Sporobolomyces koalae]|uniref:uncharacterized protein n=1 Tax=Sporobolomyces koalae TaxID=500713 RepID=UPI003176F8A0
MPKLNKSTILFILLNWLRLLSVVAICLAFSGEVVTMVNDLKNAQQAHSPPSPVLSTTAINNIFRRSFPVPVQEPAPSRFSLIKREPTSVRDLASATSRSRTSTSTQAITATSARPVFSPSPTSSCAYISSTSIPTQPGGALFSTLSRICCCFVLVLSLVSEISPPITTRVGQWIERWWTYAFPPFGHEFGTGVLGAVQVFMECIVLSHAVGKLTQVSGWILFVIGILNLLCGLAFGSRLKVIRSPFADSTSPSALRRLRLTSSTQSKPPTSSEGLFDDDYHENETGPSRARTRSGKEESRKWYRFDNPPTEEHSIVLDTSARREDHSAADHHRVRFDATSPSVQLDRVPKRSKSRNGPNGIIISAPMHLRGGAGDTSSQPDDQLGRTGIYGEMKQVRNEMSSTGTSKNRANGISLPPPVYSGSH